MKQGWEEKTLGELCAIRPPKSETRERLSSDELVSFVPMEYLGINSKYFSAPLKKQLKEVINNYTYFADGDVLLAKITPCFENGKLGIASNLSNGAGFGSSEYIVFRPKSELNNEFLYYFLLREEFRIQGAKQMKGAVGHKRIPPDFIENYLIKFPKDLAEQQRIVELLDRAFEDIEQLKENAKQNLRNARELFESYRNLAFKINSEKWEEKRIIDICKNLDSKRIPITQNLRKKGIYPYYGASGIVDYVDNYIFDEDLLLVSEDGANLLARTYSIAFSVTGKIWVNNHAHVLKFDNIYTQKFIEYYLNSISLVRYVTGMAQPKLNQAALNSILIKMPSLEKQKEIVEKLDAMQEETRQLEQIYQQKILLAEELKQSILQKAFSGELTREKTLV